MRSLEIEDREMRVEDKLVVKAGKGPVVRESGRSEGGVRMSRVG